MKLVKFTSEKDLPILINPEFIESIEGTEFNTRITLASGRSIKVDLSPYKVIEELRDDKVKSEVYFS